MKWNLIFSSITALSALVGSGAIILAVRQFKFSTWLKAQEIFVDSDFREAKFSRTTGRKIKCGRTVRKRKENLSVPEWTN